MSDPSTAERRSRALVVGVSVIAVLLSIHAARLASTLMVPLAFALFWVAVFWPAQRRLESVMPRGLAAVVSVLGLLVALALLGAAVWWAADSVAARADVLGERLSELEKGAREWLTPLGVSPGDLSDSARALASAAPGAALDALGGLVLMVAFFGLGLAEVLAWRDKLARVLPEGRVDTWLDALEETGRQIRRYLVVRAGIGALTGVACGLATWAMGLELPFLWGLLNFLLNFVPTIGSIVGVAPPVLYALVQFDGLTMPLVALAVVGGVQLLMGNWIDPLVQGRYLSLSPVVVLASVVFGGWLWGSVGALIAVPITLAVVILTRRSARLSWIATLLEQRDDEAPEEGRQRSGRMAEAS